MTVRTTEPYDIELGMITESDREYAEELLEDLSEMRPGDIAGRIETTAQWLRKVRYEAVIADRKLRADGETGETK